LFVELPEGGKGGLVESQDLISLVPSHARQGQVGGNGGKAVKVDGQKMKLFGDLETGRQKPTLLQGGQSSRHYPVEASLGQHGEAPSKEVGRGQRSIRHWSQEGDLPIPSPQPGASPLTTPADDIN
jgi:hypothetical protein